MITEGCTLKHRDTDWNLKLDPYLFSKWITFTLRHFSITARFRVPIEANRTKNVPIEPENVVWAKSFIKGNRSKIEETKVSRHFQADRSTFRGWNRALKSAMILPQRHDLRQNHGPGKIMAPANQRHDQNLTKFLGFPFLFSIPLQIFKKRGVGRGGTNQSRVFQTLRLPIGQKNDLQKKSNKFTGFSSALRRYP